MRHIDLILVVVLGIILGFGSSFVVSSLTWDNQIQKVHEINALHDEQAVRMVILLCAFSAIAVVAALIDAVDIFEDFTACNGGEL